MPFNYPIIIDDGFRDLLDPVDPEALQQLEQSLLKEGCRDALVVWYHEGKYVLIDGHNRHSICTKHNIDYKVVVKDEKEIPDRDAAEDWIDANQLGRRNLTPQRFQLILGRRYNRQKKRISNPVGNNQHTEVECHNDTQPQSESTAEKLGREHGVSPRTVKRAGKAAEKMDHIKKAGHKDLVKAVEAGKIDVTNAAKIAELPKDVQDTVLADAALNNWSGRQMVEEAKRLSGEPVKKAMSRPKNGLQYAKMAIVQLEKISPTDEQRVEAFELVMDWIKENQ